MLLGFIPVALVAMYIIDSRIQGRVSSSELSAWLEDGRPLTIIDVRSKGEYEGGHVPGALHIPFTSAFSRAPELSSAQRPLVVYCGHGPRASMARAAWRLKGIGKVLSLEGHFAVWSAEERALE